MYDSEIELIATHAVSVQITGYVVDSFPAVVSCALCDAHEHMWQFVEKVPIVSLAHLTGYSKYPQPGEIRCEVRSRYVDAAGRALVTIDTGLPDRVETVDGNTIFDVLAEQLVEIPGDA